MSFWRLYYHLIWSTHQRQPLITPEVEAKLFPYLVHDAAKQAVFVYAINGWVDHIHIVAAIPPKLAVAEVVRKLKGGSSHMINHTCNLGQPFAWQRGYGALSIGEQQRAIAEAYVQRQKEHHGNGTVLSWLECASEQDDGPFSKIAS